MPVFRPLIGLDKIEIIEKAEKIGTYETSILPYEDCCTVFTPRHPRTRPTPDYAAEVEAMIANEEALIDEAVKSARLKVIDAYND
jgi:thiamine biosynthesis protein ThiI